MGEGNMNKRHEILLACSDVDFAESLSAQFRKRYSDKIIISIIDEWQAILGLEQAGYKADVMLTDVNFIAAFMNANYAQSQNDMIKTMARAIKSVGVLRARDNMIAGKVDFVRSFFENSGLFVYDIFKYSGVDRIFAEVCKICAEVSRMANEKSNIYPLPEEVISSSELYSYVPVLREEVSSQLDYTTAVTDETVRAATDKVLHEKDAEGSQFLAQLNDQQKKWLSKAVFDSIKKLDILQPLLEDDSITEIMINGYHTVFIEKNSGIVQLDCGFESEKRFSDIIQKMVSEVNKIVNEFSPVVDLHLEDGSRVNIVLPPVALDGPVMTIRKFPDTRYSLEDLANLEMMPKETVGILKDMVKVRCNIFISGGTGSGKTTLLNALASEIPEEQRVVTIEDAAELRIQNVPNMVRLETRNANSEQKGAVRMEELIKTSLRMRPDRIIVGEVRGEEVFSMLQAMNTGHDGSLSTGHANSSYDMLSRLEAMALMAADIPVSSVRKQIVSAIDILIHISRMETGLRKISEISEVVADENAGRDGVDITINKLFELKDGVLCRTNNPMLCKEKFCLYGMENRAWIGA